MELALAQLPALLTAIWWPFCRILGMFSASPIIGENMVPISVRVLLSLVLAVIVMPFAQPVVAIEPISLHAVVATGAQLLIGFALGLAFHLVMATLSVLGFTSSSQSGLSMAVMNDPMSGTSSDVISNILNILCILVFFSIDGHLVLTGVVGASFNAWPVDAGFDAVTLSRVAWQVAWVFSGALLLALPVIFSSLVVQIGFGFLNRVAPALNLFSLGFSVVTLSGLFVLLNLTAVIPSHFVRLTNQVLTLLEQVMS
jgi:flagellar biosynthetic protein FliR